MKLSRSILCWGLLLILLSSCGGDDDDVMNGLEGTWTAIEFGASLSLESLVMAQIDIESTSLDYCLTFDGESFTTSGAYDINAKFDIDGFPTQTINQSYTSVQGSGDYTLDGSTIFVTGSFYDYELDGLPETGISDADQQAEYFIDDNGRLVVDQNESITQSEQGITVTVDVISRSVWERK